jgi:hypothetical protein
MHMHMACHHHRCATPSIVMWCGVVWCGVVWCGVVWCGVVWCGVVWCGVVWCAAGHATTCRAWAGGCAAMTPARGCCHDACHPQGFAASRMLWLAYMPGGASSILACTQQYQHHHHPAAGPLPTLHICAARRPVSCHSLEAYIRAAGGATGPACAQQYSPSSTRAGKLPPPQPLRAPGCARHRSSSHLAQAAPLLIS